ncbi:hypothetical protein BV25DRAFT_1846580 [Artomyces pyxidatus]|uniref:Uncharacterized protein n=1 Tax=Artomyces pyxidatus TaxID=48021 RepID=A0ACB8TJ30_9AGAM|nr:hypothetical protein BV25DRAFT_1846580 [Artomyces pyxidatus]
MTSTPSEPIPVVGSASSGYSIKDAIASYRRTQYLLSSSGVAASFTNMSLPADDEEAISPVAEDIEEEEEQLTPRPEDEILDEFIGNLQFDGEDEPTASSERWEQPPPLPNSPGSHSLPKPTPLNERTPLLVSPRKAAYSKPPALRRLSTTGAASTKTHVIGGKSTFGQTVSNAAALLLGIGMLSEPLAFAYSGWICGTLLIVFYGYITCYTAKFLAQVVITDPHVRSYADIGQKAFGPKSMPFVSFMFCFEIFSVCVVLITLYADSLNAVIPAFSSNTYKIMGLVILIPTVFLPLSLLSYTSIIGIISTVFLIVVIFVDGFSISDTPGSLWTPAPTEFGFGSLEKLGLAFGLFMAGFGAHAAIPSLAADMIDPSQFDLAMNYAFAFATFIYAVIGIAGYLMFGDDVMDEISQNLLQVPGYSPVLNKIALWMLVITPLTKFALGSRPLNLTLEVLLGLDVSDRQEEHEHFHKTSLDRLSHQSNRALKRVFIGVERVVFVLLATTVSILVPDFSSMMAILGSFSAFIMCVIGPVAAKMALKQGTRWDVVFLLTAITMAAWGSGAAFWSTTQ